MASDGFPVRTVPNAVRPGGGLVTHALWERTPWSWGAARQRRPPRLPGWLGRQQEGTALWGLGSWRALQGVPSCPEPPGPSPERDSLKAGESSALVTPHPRPAVGRRSFASRHCLARLGDAERWSPWPAIVCGRGSPVAGNGHGLIATARAAAAPCAQRPEPRRSRREPDAEDPRSPPLPEAAERSDGSFSGGDGGTALGDDATSPAPAA